MAPLGLSFLLALALASAHAEKTQAPTALLIHQPVNLKFEPQLLTPYDRSLLEGASYQFLANGFIEDAQRRALNKEELRQALEALRAARLSSGLAVFEEAQQALQKNNGRLPPQERGRIQYILARDWDVIPPDIRGGLNELLQKSGAEPVPKLDLAWVRNVEKAWETKQPFEYEGGNGPKIGRPDFAQTQHMPRPPPEEVVGRLRELGDAGYKDHVTGEMKPYAPELQESLKNIARHASSQDWEAVRRFLGSKTPVLLSNKESFPYSKGAAWTDELLQTFDPDGKPPVRVVMPEYDVMVNGRRLPHSDPGYYENMGLPAPKVEALDPAKSGRVNGRFEYFSDGSYRVRPDERDRSITLFHEILHIDTHIHGAGCNHWANEQRSFAGQNRLESNWDEADRLAGRSESRANAQWKDNPSAYWDRVLGIYMGASNGEVKKDEVLVKDHLNRIEKALAASGPEFERMKRVEVERLFKRYEDMEMKIIDDASAISPLDAERSALARARVKGKFVALKESPQVKNWDFRAYLVKNRESLLRDQEETMRTFLDDWKWHETRGLSYDASPPALGRGTMRRSTTAPPPPRSR